MLVLVKMKSSSFVGVLTTAQPAFDFIFFFISVVRSTKKQWSVPKNSHISCGFLSIQTVLE